MFFEVSGIAENRESRSGSVPRMRNGVVRTIRTPLLHRAGSPPSRFAQPLAGCDAYQTFDDRTTGRIQRLHGMQRCERFGRAQTDRAPKHRGGQGGDGHTCPRRQRRRSRNEGRGEIVRAKKTGTRARTRIPVRTPPRCGASATPTRSLRAVSRRCRRRRGSRRAPC